MKYLSIILIISLTMTNITQEEINIIHERVLTLTRNVYKNLIIDVEDVNAYKNEIDNVELLSKRISDKICQTINKNIAIFNEKYSKFKSIIDRLKYLYEISDTFDKFTKDEIKLLGKVFDMNELTKINDEITFIETNFNDCGYIDFLATFNNTDYSAYIMNDAVINNILFKYHIITIEHKNLLKHKNKHITFSN